MEACYVYRKEMNQEELILKYQNKILSNPKYDSNICKEQISITEGFLVYPFMDGIIKNLAYLVIRKGKQQTGVIDVSCNLASRDFMLRELSLKSFIQEPRPIEDFTIFNAKDIETYEKEFINRILEKATKAICKRHNVVLTDRTNDIDISPIQKFEELEKRYYLEEVYFIDYFSKKHKKPYKSVFSPLMNDFYSFDYKKSEVYEQFYKLYKRPIVYIPKDYLDHYYSIAFQTYLITIEELKYIKPSQLLTKLRKNVKYKEYSKSNEYLHQLIFYFKKKDYLKELAYQKSSLINDVFYYYLTLQYNPQSGYQLAELVKNNVIEDNWLRLIEKSNRLGHTLSKKELYEYYSEPKNYNAYYLKRYS